jgi:hypothetical protein
MNQRIQEFADEAGADIWGDKVVSSQYFDIEKFAQLIVQECAKVCDLYAMPDGTSETAIILASAIRRKFGVE